MCASLRLNKEFNMIYRSTRGNAEASDTRAVLNGIAPDGGLYVYPELGEKKINLEEVKDLDCYEMSSKIISFLLPGFENTDKLVDKAYRGRFSGGQLAPLAQVGDVHVMELWHGPTSAFKDVALCMLPRLMISAKEKENDRKETVILTATSGDTGKAALEGFHDVDGTKIIVFYPDGGVSKVQFTQMATQEGKNVYVCGIRGNFDDCQTGVKIALNAISRSDTLKQSNFEMSSANSINIGRLTPQVVYYFTAYFDLVREGKIKIGDRVDYVVPTGNFGDILAGYFAKRIGLPVGRLVCASNQNNILTDFIHTGIYDRRRDFYRTSSPSMDILVSSNLERLLFYSSGCDSSFVSDCMSRLSRDGVYSVDEKIMEEIRKDFSAGCCSEKETAETISSVWNESHYLCDPHTAVAMKVAKEYMKTREDGNEVVVLSTASPYKFSKDVLTALGGKASADEFDDMDELSRVTGIEIPENLSTLRNKKILHRDVEDKENIISYILDKLGLEGIEK